MPLPTPITIEELKAFDVAAKDHRDKCRYHPIVALIEKAVHAGLLPIPEATMSEGLNESANGLSFRKMLTHAFEPFILVDFWAGLFDAQTEMTRNVNVTFYLPIPLFRTNTTITDKAFLAWCKERRQDRLKRVLATESDRKARIGIARALVNKPVPIATHSDY